MRAMENNDASNASDGLAYWIPVEGLTVRTRWPIGAVTLCPSEDALGRLQEQSDAEWGERFAPFLAEIQAGSVAEVVAQDADEAIDLVGQAIDLLRVFQHVRHFTTDLAQFGLPGDLRHEAIHFARVTADDIGYGVRSRGQARGWTFSDPEAWPQAKVFLAVARAIGRDDVSEGHRRALIGSQLLSEALLEQRGTFRMVALVSALEAWLLPRAGTAQTFRLARAVAYFGCGRHDNDLCGRGRETCPYLELDPDNSSDRRRIRQLREKGAEPPWRCSEWHRVVDWYEVRSDVVHGAGPDISFREATNALYWTARYLAEPILEWLVAHPDDPIGELEAAFSSLPTAPDWASRLGPL